MEWAGSEAALFYPKINITISTCIILSMSTTKDLNLNQIKQQQNNYDDDNNNNEIVTTNYVSNKVISLSIHNSNTLVVKYKTDYKYSEVGNDCYMQIVLNLVLVHVCSFINCPYSLAF